METYVGQTATASRKFDAQSVMDYAKLTGDFNPVHFEETYAAQTIFKKPIVQGPFVLTLVTTLFANELPGPGSVYLSHNVQFIAPVYYNDVITATLEVIEINAKNHIFIQTVCTNQHGNTVLKGVARLKKF